MERLKAGIDLETQGLEQGIEESRKIIKRLESQLISLKTKLETVGDADGSKRIADDIKKVETALVNVRGRFNDYTQQLMRNNTASNSATGSQQRLNNAIRGGNGVAIEFNRIIQDAPFGLIGIGNNIQQLVSNFAQMQTSGRKTGDILKSVFTSLISPANLLVLGISVVTSALTFFAMKSRSAKEETESFREEIEKSIESMGDYEKAILKAQGGAQRQLSEIQALITVIDDETLSRDRRVQAIERLFKQFPQLKQNFDTEKLLAGETAEAYEILADAIVQKSIAEASAQKISELFLQNLALQKKETEELARLEKERANFNRGGTSTIGSVTGGAGSALTAFNKSQDETQLTKIRGEIDKNKNSMAEFRNEIVKYQKEFAGLFDAVDDGLDKTDPQLIGDKARTDAEIWAVAFRNQISKDAGKSVEAFFASMNEQFASENEPIVVDVPIKIGAMGEGMIDNPAENLVGQLLFMLTEMQPTAEQAFLEFGVSINRALVDGLSTGIGDIAFAIGDAFGSGQNALKAGGSALLGVMAGVLNDFGQLAIGAGIASLGIKKALTPPLDPFRAIAGGVALVALAGVVGAKAKKISGGLGGGGGVSGGVASSNAGSSTSFGGAGSGLDTFGSFDLNTRLSGTDIILSIERTQKSNK